MTNKQVNDAWMTAIVNASNDAIISFALDDTILSWNPGAAAMLGYTDDEVIGQPLRLLSPPDRVDEQDMMLHRLASGGIINQYETILMRKDGGYVPVDKTISPVRDNANTIVGAVAIIQDITERKQAEMTLRTSEERFRRYITVSSEVVYTMSADWSEMHHLIGKAFIQDTEHSSTNWFQRYIPDGDQPQVQSAVEDAIRNKQIFELEHPVFRVDGTVGWTFSRAVPVFDAHGDIIEWFGTASDITERKRAEAALHASEHRARTLVKTLPGAAAFIFDRALRYVLADGEALYAAGRTPTDYEGKLFDDAVSPDSLASMKPLLLGALDGIAFEDENVEGGITFLSRGVPLHGEHGEVTGVLVVSYNISERKQSEIALLRAYAMEQAARTEAEAALYTRDQFLSIASHELRTPLTSLLGYTTMLRSGMGVSPEQTDTITDRIIRQAQRLSGLIGELLDISRLQQGQFTVILQPVDVTFVMAQVLDATKILSPSTIHLITFSHPDEPAMITGDVDRLEQVFQNMLSNAIKYSPKGGAVAVLLRTTARDAIIEIADQGIGIPEAARAHLFEPFYRAANVGTQASGFGLGLYIVQEIVERHGGRIEVDSVEGEGSIFRVLLPLLRT